MIKKLQLIGSGNEGNRNYFILSKEDSFFSLFPRFLISCGFKNIGIYEDYQENKPSLEQFNNKLEHFQNEEFNIDLIFTQNKIIMIVRTEFKNRARLLQGIKNIVEIKV